MSTGQHANQRPFLHHAAAAAETRSPAEKADSRRSSEGAENADSAQRTHDAPAVQHPMNALEAAARSIQEVLGRAPRVLVAEDDDELRWALSTALGQTGFVVEQVSTSAELLNRFADAVGEDQRAFDVVLTDVRMPGDNSINVVSALRDTGWRTPVVFISAFDDAVAKHKLEQLDHAAFMQKPITLEALVEVMEQFIWADLAEGT